MTATRQGTSRSARGLRTAVARVGALLPRRSDWAQMRPRGDLTAGVMVGLVALPLALGFGVSSGVGAQAGLVTAVVAGVVAAVFGGSRVQVSGPTGAMTVVLVPIIAAHGTGGVLVVGMMAGLVLVALGYAGAGRVIRYVPVTVVEGFTVGIALIIALQQVPAALGASGTDDKVAVAAGRAVAEWVARPEWATALLTTAVIAVILLLAWLRPRLPGALVAVVLATLAVPWLDLDVATIGALPAGIPAPTLPTVPLPALQSLILPAVAVAALAALESLLSATVADGMSVGRRHDSDRELVGQGLANLAAPVFGGIPATAAIARTAVNIRSGASSRLAAVTHSVFLLAATLVAARWVAMIPLAALAGVLIATAARMVRVSSVRPLLRASRGDAAALVLTTAATVVFDLVTAVVVGLVVAGFVALRRAARAARLDEVPLDGADHTAEERNLLDEHIVAFRLDGPLFFAAAHDFLLELTELTDVRVVVLRMSRVTAIDATGATVLGDTISQLQARGTTVLLSGAHPGHLRVLREIGVHGHLAHERHLFDSTPDAIAHARVHAARVPHTPATGPPPG